MEKMGLQQLMQLLSGLGGVGTPPDPRAEVLKQMTPGQPVQYQDGRQNMPMGQRQMPDPREAAAPQPSAQPSDEEMLAKVSRNMAPQTKPENPDEDPSDEWEGADDGVPTKRDLEYLDKNPTDGVINNFIKTFPEYADQTDIAQGGKGLDDGGDEYAISADEKADLMKNRKTQIDER